MKKNLTTSTIIAVLALVVILVGAPNALAGDTICNGSFIGGTVDNVIAEDGCDMSETTVTGNVWIEEGAVAYFNYITVYGNFQTDGAQRVLLSFSEVYGDVQIKNTNSAGVYETYVGGSIEAEENKGTGFSIFKNIVEGNVQANKNTGEYIYIDSCIIGGNLQCDENDPPPFWWCNRNTVSGNKDGQCSNLPKRPWPTGICH